MSARYMKDDEIVMFYRQAANRPAQIKILAQLNDCEEEEICDVLRSQGFEVKHKKKPKEAKEERRTYVGEWTEDEVQTLLSMCREGHRNNAIALKLGRSTKAIGSMIRKIRASGVTVDRRDGGRPRAWTEEENQTLLRMYNERCGCKSIAETLGKTTGAVSNQIQELRREGRISEYRRKKRSYAR